MEDQTVEAVMERVLRNRRIAEETQRRMEADPVLAKAREKLTAANLAVVQAMAEVNGIETPYRELVNTLTEREKSDKELIAAIWPGDEKTIKLDNGASVQRRTSEVAFVKPGRGPDALRIAVETGMIPALVKEVKWNADQLLAAANLSKPFRETVEVQTKITIAIVEPKKERHVSPQPTSA